MPKRIAISLKRKRNIDNNASYLDGEARLF
jgi:hypothetical protein